MTCWRRLLDELRKADKLDFIRFSMVGASVRSPWVGRTPAEPDGSGQAGQQASHHLGNPRYRRDALRHRVNRHDSVAFEDLVDTLPAVGSQRAGPGYCLRSPVTFFSSGASSRTSQRVPREVRHGFFAMSRSMRRRTFTARTRAISICSGQTWMFLSPPPALSNSALADILNSCPGSLWECQVPWPPPQSPDPSGPAEQPRD